MKVSRVRFQRKNGHEEEQIHRRTDHRFSQAVGAFTSDSADFRAANNSAFGAGNAYGSSSKILMNGKEYTWHHSQYDGKLQLIPKDIHDAVKHTGGAAVCGTRR
ncbi:HNH endonuclease [Variovorax sp. SG517]|uniref:HNH endonuclease n=1 Tax=Variovorax sp. SG517 TaxID=2587117 RepID=UPI00159E0381